MFKVVNGGKMPTRGSKYSACVDLYANEECVIGAGETAMVGLGVCIDLELLEDEPMFREDTFGGNLGFIEGEFSEELFSDFMKTHYLQLNPRSSLRAKGLISNTGIIDLDFAQEIQIIIHNQVKHTFIMRVINEVTNKIGLSNILQMYNKGNYRINKGDKIAQITLLEHKSYLFGINTEDKRNGGFGSTNKKDKEC